MPPEQPFDSESLLSRLSATAGARWADLFSERRVLGRRQWGPEGAGEPVYSHDSGSSARIVLEDGRIRQASATGGREGSLRAAVKRLLAGEGSDGLSGRPEGKADELSAADICRGPALNWLISEQKGLDGYVRELAERLRVESARGAEVTVSAVVGAQEIHHISTDSPPVEDLRTGITLEVVSRGDGSEIRRQWGAASVEALQASHPAQTESKSIEEARRRLADAAPPPAGEFPVVLAAPAGGLLVHEAIGHLLEGDVFERGGSILTGLSGLTGVGTGEADGLALSPLLTVVEDPGRNPGRGGYEIDDEGVSAERTVLVEKGRIVGALSDRWSSTTAGRTSTGNGRRQSHREPVLPRIASIVVEPGPHDPEEIVHDTIRGIYLMEPRSGFADPASGEFVLHAAEGRLIENGRLTASVRDLVITGTVHRHLAEIDRVGNDASSDGGATSCVRNGQAVPTIVGAPTMRIPRIRVSSMNSQ